MESIVKKKVVNKPIHQNCQVGIHSAPPTLAVLRHHRSAGQAPED